MKTEKKSKYEEPIQIEASPFAVIQSLFGGKPKPKNRWRYLKKGEKPSAEVKK